jgi:hypothetical protein
MSLDLTDITQTYPDGATRLTAPTTSPSTYPRAS